ncbi:hypothetical protein SNE40_015189 [Patella caerulea]|uniref:CARD domain-containing protein n=1 Tax=Patella caerulea TaxID=87958 RepID=A0AAN8JMS8_PATCE
MTNRRIETLGKLARVHPGLFPDTHLRSQGPSVDAPILNKVPMPPEDARKLRNNYIYLQEKIDAADLSNYLFQAFILDDDDVKRIEITDTKALRNKYLLDTLLRRGRRAWGCFVAGLKDCGFKKVHSELLKRTEIDDSHLSPRVESLSNRRIQPREVDEMDEKIKELKVDNNLKAKEITTLQTKVIQLDEKVSDLKNQLKERDGQIVKLVSGNLSESESGNKPPPTVEYLETQVVDLDSKVGNLSIGFSTIQKTVEEMNSSMYKKGKKSTKGAKKSNTAKAQQTFLTQEAFTEEEDSSEEQVTAIKNISSPQKTTSKQKTTASRNTSSPQKTLSHQKTPSTQKAATQKTSSSGKTHKTQNTPSIQKTQKNAQAQKTVSFQKNAHAQKTKHTPRKTNIKK